MYFFPDVKYSSKQGWNQEWINFVEEIMRDEFIHNYAAYVVPQNQKFLKLSSN